MKNKAAAALAALVLLFGGFTGGFFLGRNTRVGTIQTTKTVTVEVPGETVVILQEVLVTLPPETVPPTQPSGTVPSRSGSGSSTQSGETAKADASPSKSTKPREEKVTFPVNINTASKKELDALPGIGEVLAQRIIDYRQAHGKFQHLEELTNVSGIGQKRLEALLDYVTVGG